MFVEGFHRQLFDSGTNEDFTMEYNQNIPENCETLFIPSRNDNIHFPVVTYFLDLSRMYMGAIRWHWHNEIEIIIINNGRARFLVDDAAIEIHAGQAVMVNQNVLHSIRPINDEKCTFYSLIFHPSFLFGYEQTYYSDKYLTPILNSVSLKYILLEESVSWQETLIDHINNALAATLTKKFGYELVTKAALELFWAGILEHCYTPTAAPEIAPEPSPDSIRVKEALLYIEKHHMEAITLEDIASSIHVSKSECCRCFKRTLKFTPIEYVMKYRIFEATRKIKLGAPEANSISDLAMSVGFNNASYFNKLFKKFLNCTPSQYKDLLHKHPVSSPENSPFHLPSPFEENF